MCFYPFRFILLYIDTCLHDLFYFQFIYLFLFRSFISSSLLSIVSSSFLHPRHHHSYLSSEVLFHTQYFVVYIFIFSFSLRSTTLTYSQLYVLFDICLLLDKRHFSFPDRINRSLRQIFS